MDAGDPGRGNSKAKAWKWDSQFVATVGVGPGNLTLLSGQDWSLLCPLRFPIRLH